MGSDITKQEEQDFIRKLAAVPTEFRDEYIREVIRNLSESQDKVEVERNLKKMFSRIDLIKSLNFPNQIV
jgi:hypothetical protein